MTKFSAWPILWQMSGLALAAVIAAQSISFGIVALFPTAPPKGLTIDAVADAVRAGGATDGFEARIDSAMPADADEKPDGMVRVIEASLAGALGLPATDVHVTMLSESGSAAKNFPVIPADNGGGIAVFNPGAGGMGPGGKPPPLPEMLRKAAVDFAPFETAVRQPSGAWLVVRPSQPGLLNPEQQRVLLAFALSVLILGPLAWLAARHLAQPMQRFADAVERAGPDTMTQKLTPEGGPELRALVGAINRMRERLLRHVEDRTTAVAAIAHDLRTPLTSLRLRAESVQPDMRGRMTTDIDRLILMVEQVLAFAKGEQMREPVARIDLGLLAMDCAREIEDSGGDVECRSAAGVWVTGEPVNLRRALTNLIQNAVKYGERARVDVSVSGGRAVFQVDDDGPGLPEATRDRVFEPFMRLEPSRNRATGGAGLGLALVSTVVRVHGGSIDLINMPEGGLRAVLSLPHAQMRQAEAEQVLQRA